jgi:cytosine/adenosine deaminase-related metal-dependent hydrolase
VSHDLGFLSTRPLLPHGTYLGGATPTPERIERELDWLAESGATIVHCPIVSARHGNALISFSRFRDRDINIALGTDTYPPDIVANIHTGIMVTRLVEQSMRVSAADYYTASTIGGADAIGRPDLGRLMPGALADITIIELDQFHMGQFIDLIQTTVLSGSGRDFSTVIVNGLVVVREHQIASVELNLPAMHRRAQAQFEKLMASYPERSLLHPPVEQIFAPSFPIAAAVTET